MGRGIERTAIVRDDTDRTDFLARLAAVAEAGAIKRRHKRVGHLVQNRYTSIGVEEAPYRLARVRSLHCNPRRAQEVVSDRRGLQRYRGRGTAPSWEACPAPGATATMLAQGRAVRGPGAHGVPHPGGAA